ncbi:hypothetical protein A7979_08505 [Rothia nasimurium]|uniref:DUF4878 domain-containing protein n=2 Tax=Rothia nasimurium TaxID=85336 RepID=A0A1Y1RSG6_9MICC|nr:hypothetical protein A7979_08505 [Rothia nasimurium]
MEFFLMSEIPNPQQPNQPNFNQSAQVPPLSQQDPGQQPIPGGLPGQPVPQGEGSKKNMGLLIGGLLALAIAVIIVAVLFFSGIFGGSSRIDSADEFNQKVSDITADSNVNKCFNADETILAGEMDSLKQDVAEQLSVDPAQVSMLLCATFDTTSLEGAVDSDPEIADQVLLAVHTGEGSVADHVGNLQDTDLSIDSTGWGVYGENWLVYAEKVDQKVKDAAMDQLKGEEVPTS